MPLLALPAFSDNYVWALADDEGRAVVVDPGDATPVLQVASEGIVPVAVLLTHHHRDHIGGVAGLLDRWPGLPVFAPIDERIPLATHRVGEGETIAAGSQAFDVIAVPGHTLSHIAFIGGGLLFSGDTLFSLGCGRLFEGTAAQMHASLMRLAALPGDTRVCCGHEYTAANAAFALAAEPDNTALQQRAATIRALRAKGRPSLPVTLDEERRCNPFLRCDSPAIQAAVARHTGRAPVDEVDTFAGLRRWKDGFTA